MSTTNLVLMFVVALAPQLPKLGVLVLGLGVAVWVYTRRGREAGLALGTACVLLALAIPLRAATAPLTAWLTLTQAFDVPIGALVLNSGATALSIGGQLLLLAAIFGWRDPGEES